MNQLVDKLVDMTGGIAVKIDTEKILGFVNKYVEKFVAYAMLALGLLATILYFIAMGLADNGISFSLMMKSLGNSSGDIGSMIGYALGVAIVAALLVPKMLQVLRSLVEKDAVDTIRPEVGTVLKVSAIGGFVFSVVQLCCGEFVMAIVGMISNVLSLIVLAKPESFGFKLETPANAVEEIVSLVRLPFRVALKLVSPIVAGIIIWALYNAVSAMIELGKCDIYPHGFAPFAGATAISAGLALIPVVLFGAYILWIIIHAIIDILRSIASRAHRS